VSLATAPHTLPIATARIAHFLSIATTIRAHCDLGTVSKVCVVMVAGLSWLNHYCNNQVHMSEGGTGVQEVYVLTHVQTEHVECHCFTKRPQLKK
jgi:hypothetical protein